MGLRLRVDLDPAYDAAARLVANPAAALGSVADLADREVMLAAAGALMRKHEVGAGVAAWEIARRVAPAIEDGRGEAAEATALIEGAPSIDVPAHALALVDDDGWLVYSGPVSMFGETTPESAAVPAVKCLGGGSTSERFAENLRLARDFRSRADEEWLRGEDGEQRRHGYLLVPIERRNGSRWVLAVDVDTTATRRRAATADADDVRARKPL